MGDRQLSVIRGILHMSTYRQKGTSTEPRILTLDNGAKLQAYMINPQENARIDVINGGRMQPEVVNMGSSDEAQPAVIRVRNGLVNITTRHLKFSDGVTDKSSSKSCNSLLLEEGGVVETPVVEHYRSPQGEIVFKGGKLVHVVSNITDRATYLKPSYGNICQ